MQVTKSVAPVLLAAGVLSGCGATGDVDSDRLGTLLTGAAQSASDVSCELSADALRVAMLEVVNTSRQTSRTCGSRVSQAAGTVQWNDRLAVAAVSHANDMASANFFDHTGSDGLGVSDRVDASGYDWRAVGENIAAGQKGVVEVHQAWLDSPGHCRNIMNAEYTEIGAACVSDDTSDFGSYWVVVFGDQF